MGQVFDVLSTLSPILVKSFYVQETASPAQVWLQRPTGEPEL